jgi:hypothetical protein
MSDVASLVSGASLITEIFGFWPSFHDAEVLEVTLQRGAADHAGPSLSAKIHVFEMTADVGSSGHFVCRNHMIVEFRFSEIENLEMEGFNHQNAIDRLIIKSDAAQLRRCVTFNSAYGLGADFTCSSVEVLSATAGIPDGSVYARGKI